MQRMPMETHTVSPFGDYILTEKQLKEVVENATRTLFYEIYHAAKNRDSEALSRIKSACLNEDSYLGIYWNGETPITLLAHEGDDEAVEFISQRTLTAHCYTLENGRLEYKLAGVSDEVSFAVHRKNNTLESMQNYSYLHEYPFLNLMTEHLANKCKQSKDYILSQHFSDVFCAYTYASLGMIPETMKLIGRLEQRESPHILQKYLANIAYLFARYGHDDASRLFLKEHKTAVLRGYLEGGYLNYFARFLSSLSIMEALPLSVDLINSPINAKNLLHVSVLWPILSLYRPISSMKMVYKHFFNLPLSTFHGPLPQYNLNKPLPFFQLATKTNYWATTYHLNFEQTLAVFQSGTLTWLLEGIKSASITQYSVDVLAKILAYIPETELAHADALDLFLKVYFVFNRTFLIDDLDCYMSGFKWDRYHVKRAESLKQACMEVSTSSSLGKLVAQQLGLFAQTVIGNINSKYKHEHPLQDTREDKLLNVLYKGHTRLRLL